MSTVPQRLAALRSAMEARGIDAYLVPSDDFHMSEYVGEYFKCRKYLTGFTGSAGTAGGAEDQQQSRKQRHEPFHSDPSVTCIAVSVAGSTSARQNRGITE